MHWHLSVVNIRQMYHSISWIDVYKRQGLERELYYKRVNEVSGGQRQRMMIAVASMIGKSLTIVDEPTSALDSDPTGKVLAFFRKQTEKGSAILAVSHDEGFAEGCDQHIICLLYTSKLHVPMYPEVHMQAG